MNAPKPYTTPDVVVRNSGSVCLFEPVTPAAKDWVAEHVQLEGCQWLGASFAVEHRFASGLAEGMLEAGLEVR